MPLPAKRMLKQDEVADYVGVSKVYFLKMVKEGTYPDATYRNGHVVLWDRRVIDSVIDGWSANKAGQPLDGWDEV